MALYPLTLDNIVASALDFHVKSDAFKQTIQEKPLIGVFTKRQQTFPGGKGDITLPISFQSELPAISGYQGDDQVSYSNPQNTRRVSYPWKEIHAGINVTLTELKIDGISVTDSVTGENTSKHSGRDATVLTNILKAKLDDMTEGWARGFNTMLWKDGTQNAKLVPGLSSFIKPGIEITGGTVDLNNVGTTGGLSRAANPLWRNRSGKFWYEAGKTNIIDGLRKEIRQLKRYGGKPTTILCGSAFLELLEKEIHNKGFYSMTGFSKGTNTVGMGATELLGVGEFVYDPTLDDLPGYNATTNGDVDGEESNGNRSSFCYLVDTDAIQMYVMDGEDKKTHNPARPEDKYVIYKAMTWTGGMVAKQLSGCGVYQALPD
jgi:hypothetical protein